MSVVPVSPHTHRHRTSTPSGRCSNAEMDDGKTRTVRPWPEQCAANMGPSSGRGGSADQWQDGIVRNDPANSGRRRTVAAVVCDGVSPFEFAIACEVFGIDRSDLGVPWYRFVVCTPRPPVVTTKAGFELSTPHGLEALRRADTIVVTADDGQGEREVALHQALRRAHARGARILTVCRGSHTLAAAGLLDGRVASTHWMHADTLARRYPAVTVDAKVLYVDDGDILTSAGTAAGVDLCLHVVRQDYGAEIANAVARRMVVPPHRDGGQAQFVDDPVPDLPSADPFKDTLVWAETHVGEPMTVEDLARRAAMSPRTFARRFRATFGTTPHQWLLRQRVLLAQRLLETTDEGVELVARRSGFGTAANLRQHFSRSVGTSPQAYRRAFRHVGA